MPTRKRKLPQEGASTGVHFACPYCKSPVLRIEVVTYGSGTGDDGTTLASIRDDGRICCSHLQVNVKVFRK